MNNKIEKINGIDFLSLEVVKINQKEHFFHVAKAPAKQIVEMFTVSPAEYDIKKYSELAEKNIDEKDYYDTIVKNKKKQTDFQRDKDTSRVKKIRDYLNTNEYAFFPNTIICTIECIEIPEDEEVGDFILLNSGNESTTTSYFFQQENKQYVLIPVVEKSILVIDGQHRLEGLKEYFETVENDDNFQYEILLSLFIGFDRAIVAQQFYTINYEQKPVNKSILYHLMGEFSDEIDEITVLHNFTRLLNEYEKSPFHHRIKMLGKTPKNAEDRHLYSISQAFIIDELIKTISKKSINSFYQPCFLYYFTNKDLQIEIVKFIIRFFNAVKELRNDWNEPNESILSKGMGVAAMIKVIQLLIPILFIEKFEKDATKLIKVDKDSIKSYLEGIDEVDLKPFSGQGSAGSISKIKEAFIEGISFFNCTTYSVFEEAFKEKYLKEFKDWNLTNIKEQDN
jgi:DGQHR domain-containing protein